jgi:hypothetical protein
MIDRVKNEPSDDVRDDPLENLFPIHPQNLRRAFKKWGPRPRTPGV